MPLYNKINSKVLKEKIAEDSRPRTTISFYRYHQIADPYLFRDELYKKLESIDVLGRVYVAREGINAQVSILKASLEQFRAALESYHFMKGVRLNVAVDDDGKSFFKLKIKVRPKILADGLEDQTFDVTKKGKHLSAEEFNALTANEQNTLLIDMRNHYETEVGHFEGAICPDVDTFRDSLPLIENEILKGNEDKNIVMYCTGGIRCEKASAYFKHKGFKNVFQLEGGIIKYAQDAIKNGLENRFVGKNFVFDERLGERISPEIIANCHQCGKPCDTHTNCKNDACHLLFIQCDECAEKYAGCCSAECHEISLLPKEKQKELRKGIDRGRQVYKKGRVRPKLTEQFKKHLKHL
ncbi:MAG: rhodanese-related sulfurtransferase [Chitinophagales bacterium]